MTPLVSLRFLQISTALAALFAAGFVTAQNPVDPPVKPTVSGKFVGNGKNAAIKFVTVEEHEPFSGQEAITLIFTEKDPAKAKKPSFDALFGRLGSALILNVHHDGGIFGCEVTHSAHQKQGFSSLGVIKMEEFKIEGGNVSGHVSTGKELDTFGEKWEVDLTFAAPLPAKLRNASASKPAASKPEESAKEDPKPAAGPLISARNLALPKDASDVEFREAVHQIHFSCARPVEAVAGEFSANLKQQGWKDGAGSLVGRQNAILRREQGDATLTIIIQPAGAGSVVKVMTEGLDWGGGGDATPSASRKATGDSAADDVEAQARKALRDALRKRPNGL